MTRDRQISQCSQREKLCLLRDCPFSHLTEDDALTETELQAYTQTTVETAWTVVMLDQFFHEGTLR